MRILSVHKINNVFGTVLTDCLHATFLCFGHSLLQTNVHQQATNGIKYSANN
jgi:hypothetical protein